MWWSRTSRLRIRIGAVFPRPLPTHRLGARTASIGRKGAARSAMKVSIASAEYPRASARILRSTDRRTPGLLGGGSHRLMRPQEGAHPVDGAGQQLGRLAPRKDRDLGVRRQGGDIDRGPERVCRRVVRQHEDRRAAVADEIARHAVQEIGSSAIEVVKIFLDRFDFDVGPILLVIGGGRSELERPFPQPRAALHQHCARQAV